jgi:FkbM family methyltransferase
MKFFPTWVLRNRYLNKGCKILNNGLQRLVATPSASGYFQLVKVGSDYGGWFVPTGEVRVDWVIYSVGILQDLTFDLGMIQRFGCEVRGFDPTPEAIRFVTDRKKNDKLLDHFHFYPLGLWSSDTKLKFFAPRTRGWVGSYSIYNLQGTESYFEAECKSLSTVMGELGHRKINLFKMDIEGAEYEVLSDMLARQIEVDWLCVEFDQPVPLWTTWGMLKKLRTGGFSLENVDHWNFTFVHRRVLEKRRTQSLSVPLGEPI